MLSRRAPIRPGPAWGRFILIACLLLVAPLPRAAAQAAASPTSAVSDQDIDALVTTLQDPAAVTAALAQFRKKPSLGFSDCLVLEVARRAGHLPLGTFDSDLGKRFDIAWVYTVIAGVLNLLVIYDAWAGPIVRKNTQPVRDEKGAAA